MSASDVVIVSARRTPIGAFLGALSPLSAVQLGSAAIKAAIESAGIGAGDVQEVIMGCVLPAGLGQAPARQAALGAGVPIAAPATTLNKMCGSGLKAVMMAADQIRSGTASIVLAGGLESMSNAPYLLPKARSGYRMGHGEVIDHMLRDGLQSPFDGKSMGCFADATASKYGFTRAQQDAFATESVRRAMRAMQGGEFDTEVAPLTVKGRKGDTVIARDETPGTCDVEKIPSMKPAFGKDGTVTAASSSSISDGAAALVLMDAGTAASRGLKPLVRILAYASHAQEPEWFTTAPVGAIRKVLTQLAWKPHDADLYEINEAFAVVTMAAMRDIDIDHARVNVAGGACALGHPIGATGARILTTLVHALRRRGGRRGIASLCIGGGEAVALAVEVL
ncbi:MAG: acetyl-CoA C-acyltransferase [Gammaproteobacteria bacterium]|nr:MAG: acetyl-CoA C-acyltransferase [Gammaproteobacteria bacterium]TLZ50483.1 MAG: acetyl-CoA C-acyltransferase [Gammaproteobacteria bacterium]TLZ61633.1 MAG: acetyl-CoA C-acyltransferase [Gammaproteobacteria bacterium]